MDSATPTNLDDDLVQILKSLEELPLGNTDLHLDGKKALAKTLTRLKRYGEASAVYLEILDLDMPKSQQEPEEGSSSELSEIKLFFKSTDACVRGLTELKEYDKVLKLCQAVLRRHELHLGSEHPATFMAKQDIAQCLNYLGKSDKAKTMLQNLSASANEVFGSNHFVSLILKKEVGIKLHNEGERDKGVGMLKEILNDIDALKSIPGSSLDSKVEKLYEKIGKLLRFSERPDVSKLTPTMSLEYLIAYQKLQKLVSTPETPEETAILKAEIETMKKIFPANYVCEFKTPDIVEQFQLLTNRLLQLREHDALAAAYKRLLTTPPSLDKTTSKFLQMRGKQSQLAIVLTSWGKHEEAFPIFQELLADDFMTAYHGGSLLEFLEALENTISVLLEKAEYEKALTLENAHLVQLEKLFGAKKALPLEKRLRICMILYCQGRNLEAVMMLESLLLICKHELGNQHRVSLKVQTNLALWLIDIYGQTQRVSELIAEICKVLNTIGVSEEDLQTREHILSAIYETQVNVSADENSTWTSGYVGGDLVMDLRPFDITLTNGFRMRIERAAERKRHIKVGQEVKPCSLS